VRVAAMMPATRATPITSPLVAPPAATRAAVTASQRTRPSARATRSDSSLAETSTIRARPAGSRCDSCPASADASTAAWYGRERCPLCGDGRTLGEERPDHRAQADQAEGLVDEAVGAGDPAALDVVVAGGRGEHPP